MAWRTAHGIVAVVLVVMAIAAPIFFAVAIFVVPDLRRRFARRRMRKSQPETAEERRNAALAEPHVCGAFRLAVANGKLDDVKAITTRWTRAGMRVSALHGSCAQSGPTGGGFTALHIAAVEGHVAVAEYILRARGVHVDALHVQSTNASECKGRSALHYAVLNNRVACVGVLVRYGADYRIKDAFDEMPVDVAARKGFREIVTLLHHIDQLATARARGPTTTTAATHRRVSADTDADVVGDGAGATMYAGDSRVGGNATTASKTAAEASDASTISTLAALAVAVVDVGAGIGDSARDSSHVQSGDSMGGAVRRSFTNDLMRQLLLTTAALKQTLLPVDEGESEEERATAIARSDTSREGVDEEAAGAAVINAGDDACHMDVDTGCGPEVAPLFLYFASALSTQADGSGDGDAPGVAFASMRCEAVDVGSAGREESARRSSSSVSMRRRPRGEAPDTMGDGNDSTRRRTRDEDDGDNGGLRRCDDGDEAAAKLASRGYDGYGSEGTALLRGTTLFRVVGALCELVGSAYIIWRPLRSLSPPLTTTSASPVPTLSQSPYVLIYSALFYLSELVLFLPSILFVFVELWRPMTRKARTLADIVDGDNPTTTTTTTRKKTTTRTTTKTGADDECAYDAGRPSRDRYPRVDVVITCYNEPVEIVEGTLCAALSQRYPSSKMSVYLLDDGGRAHVEAMVDRVRRQARALRLCSSIRYVARSKRAGVPHNAKAGNINNCLLTEGMVGDFVVVYDSDMVAKPEFLEMTLGHFYEGESEDAEAARGECSPPRRRREDDIESGELLKSHSRRRRYRLKPRTAFVQVPQDFYNVPWDDPLGHAARFFYGPMMQGRDGMNATPCGTKRFWRTRERPVGHCSGLAGLVELMLVMLMMHHVVVAHVTVSLTHPVGTGVIFNRRALLSIGGQSYGSVTEDYKTCMVLQDAGFSTVYLNDRLVYGLAPEDVAGTMRQRLRWATGSLQIMVQDLPLLKPGLSGAQRAVLFQSQFQYLVSLPLLTIIVGPLLYLYFGITPISLENGTEFLCLFVTYYWLNRWTIFLAARCGNVDSLELWRGSQQYIYMVPNNIVAIANVIAASVFTGRDIAFAVTEKKTRKAENAKERAAGAAKTKEGAQRASILGSVLSSSSATSSSSLTRRQQRARAEARAQLASAFPFIAYYALAIGGAVYNAVLFANDELNLTEGGAVLIAFAWSLLTMLYMWPIVGSYASAVLVSCGTCVRGRGRGKVRGDAVLSASGGGGGGGGGGSVEWKAVHRPRKPGSKVAPSTSVVSPRVDAVSRVDVLRRQTLKSVVHAGFDIIRSPSDRDVGRAATMGSSEGTERLGSQENRDPTAVAFATSNDLVRNASLSLRKAATVSRTRSCAQVLPLHEKDVNVCASRTFRKSRSVGGNDAYRIVENRLYGKVDVAPTAPSSDGAEPNRRSGGDGSKSEAERSDLGQIFTTYYNAFFLCDGGSGAPQGWSHARATDRVSPDARSCEDGPPNAPSNGLSVAGSLDGKAYTMSSTTTAALDTTAGGVFGEMIASGRTCKSSTTSVPTDITAASAVAAASVASNWYSESPHASSQAARRRRGVADAVPAPTIVLPTAPRFSISMYLFFIVNGLLFLFFVGGGVAFIVLEQNQ